MKTIQNKYIYPALLILLQTFAPAFSSVLYTTVSRDSVTIGDRITLSVAVVVPSGAQVTPPPTDNGFGAMNVKEWNFKRETRSGSDSVIFDYTLATYFAENCTIPALPYIYESSSATDTLFSDPVPIKVESVLESDSVDIHDIKPPQRTGILPLWWFLLPAIVLLCGLGIWVSRKMFSGTKAGRNIISPPKPPYEEAVEALEVLELKKYPSKGMIREYAFELSDIFKRYLGRQYNASITDYTTSEVLEWLGSTPLSRDLKMAVEWFFTTTDPVKFARWKPDQATIDRFIGEIRSFLDATRETGISSTEGSGMAIQTEKPKNEFHGTGDQSTTESGSEGRQQ